MKDEGLAATGQESCGMLGAIPSGGQRIFLIQYQVSCKNMRHIKLEVVRKGVLLLFSVKSINQTQKFESDFFSQNGKVN